MTPRDLNIPKDDPMAGLKEALRDAMPAAERRDFDAFVRSLEEPRPPARRHTPPSQPKSNEAAE